MEKRNEAYEELKYTAINCALSAEDIDNILQYIGTKNMEEKSVIGQALLERRGVPGAIKVIVELAKTDHRVQEILDTKIRMLVEQKEKEALEKYMFFLSQMDIKIESRELLYRFLEEPELKILLIPKIPLFESVCCIALDHEENGRKNGIIERVSKVIKAFQEHPYIFYATQGSFTVKEDIPYTRYQIEQKVSLTIH